MEIDLEGDAESYSQLSNMNGVMSTTNSDTRILLCCNCGIPINSNSSALCPECLSQETQYLFEINRNISIPFCKQCESYLFHKWLKCELESKELLALCLKKIRGLNKLTLIDAVFLYTEPHSKRLKIQLTVQKEVIEGVILQRSIIISCSIINSQCDECKKFFTPHNWNAKVQFRQKHPFHNQTILMLEQIIIKHEMNKNILFTTETQDGLDIHLSSRTEAQKLNDFISEFLPIRTRHSKEIVSHNTHNNTFYHKYTIAIDIAPIALYDLVYIGSKLSKSFGGIEPILLCLKLSNFIHLFSFTTCREIRVPSDLYWKFPFQTVLSKVSLSEFIVINLEPSYFDDNYSKNAEKNSNPSIYRYCDAEIARLSDFGMNDNTILTRGWIPSNIKTGDYVLGYDLKKCNLSSFDDFFTKSFEKLPTDVVIVRKMYPKMSRNRSWKLKFLPKELDMNKPRNSTRFKSSNFDEIKSFEDDIESNINLLNEVRIFRNDNEEIIDPSSKEVLDMIRKLSLN